MEIVFTDKLTEINGTVTNEQGTPVPDFTVLAFPTDGSLWRPQARQIMTARPDQTGKYRIRGLPPGDYYLATVDPSEQGEWFEPAYLEEHRTGAARRHAQRRRRQNAGLQSRGSVKFEIRNQQSAICNLQSEI